MLKRIAVCSVACVLLLTSVLWSVPLLFRTRISNYLDGCIKQKIPADVTVGAWRFGFTQDFPHFTAEVDSLTVHRKHALQDIPLLKAKAINLRIRVAPLLLRRQVVIDRLFIDTPVVHLKVNDMGTNSHVLTQCKAQHGNLSAGDETLQVATPPAWHQALAWLASVRFDIQHGTLHYEDMCTGDRVSLVGLSHRGLGRKRQEKLQLDSHFQLDHLTLQRAGSPAWYCKKPTLDMKLSFHPRTQVLTWQASKLKVEPLELNFRGHVDFSQATPTCKLHIDMPTQAVAPMLGLLPEQQRALLDALHLQGQVQCKGQVTGAATEPQLDLQLHLEGGQVHVPQLKAPFQGIKMNLACHVPAGKWQDSQVRIDQLEAKLLENTLQGHVHVWKPQKPHVDVSLTGACHLITLAKLIPQVAWHTTGMLGYQLQAKGQWHFAQEKIPTLQASLQFNDVTVQRMKGMKEPLKLRGKTTLTNTTGCLTDTTWCWEPSTIQWGKEHLTLQAKGKVTARDDFAWKAMLAGDLHLGTLLLLHPVPSMKQCQGVARVRLTQEGTWKTVKKKAYQKLFPHGQIRLAQMLWQHEKMPQPLSVPACTLTFHPKALTFVVPAGKLGAAPLQFDVALTEYFTSLQNPLQHLQGKFTLKSPHLPLSVLGITPAGSGATALRQLHTICSFEAAKKCAICHKFQAHILGGEVILSGQLNTVDATKPYCKVRGQARRLELPLLYTHSKLVRTFLPLVGSMEGQLDADMAFQGALDAAYQPVYASWKGKSGFQVRKTTLRTAEKTRKHAKQLRIDLPEIIDCGCLALQARLESGRLHLKPFKIPLNGYPAKLWGSSGLDGTIDYKAQVRIETGQAGALLQNFLNKAIPTTIDLTVGVTGTHTHPKPQIISMRPGPTPASSNAKNTAQPARPAVRELGQQISGLRKRFLGK